MSLSYSGHQPDNKNEILTSGAFVALIDKMVKDEAFDANQSIRDRLTGPALKWYENLDRSYEWADLKNYLKAAFSPSLSVRQKVQLRKSLRQRESESSKEFLQRCTNAQFAITDDLWKPEDADFQREVLLNFLLGMREEFQDQVISSDNVTTDGYLLAAMEAEKSFKKNDALLKKLIAKNSISISTAEDNDDEVENDEPMIKTEAVDEYSEDGDIDFNTDEEAVKLEDVCNFTPKTEGKLAIDIVRIKKEPADLEVFKLDPRPQLNGREKAKSKSKSKSKKKHHHRLPPPSLPLPPSIRDDAYDDHYLPEPMVQMTEDGGAPGVYPGGGGIGNPKEEWKPLEDGMVYCTECGKYYENQKRFDIHKLVKHRKNQDIWACDICGKEVKNEGSLKKHVQFTCMGDRPEPCEICGKKFSDKKTVRIHVKSVHLREKPHLCAICGKGFCTPTSLRTHRENVHEKLKKYKCKVCGKAFGNQGTMYIHNQRHHEKHSFCCEQCGKRFNRPHELKRHKAVKHGEGILPHECNQCEKRFFEPKELKQHIAIAHEGVRSAVCPVCSETFTRMCAMRRHIRRKHPALVDVYLKPKNRPEEEVIEQEEPEHNSLLNHEDGMLVEKVPVPML